MFQFRLPDLGEGIAEAEIVSWLVEEGQSINADQAIVEVMTDKATVQISSPKYGSLVKRYGKEGDIIKVGSVLVELDEHDVQPPTPEVEAPLVGAPIGGIPEETRRSASDENRHESPHPPEMPPRPHRHDDSELFSDHIEDSVTVPAIREWARDHHIDLHLIKGSGPGGRIMKRDVESFAAGAPLVDDLDVRSPKSEAEDQEKVRVLKSEDIERIPLRGIRRAIAQKMTLSKKNIPHYTYVEEIDMTEIETLRKKRESIQNKQYSPLAFIAYAVSKVLPRYPLINASLDEETQTIHLKKAIHLGIATATEEGLLVPVIRNAQTLAFEPLAKAITDMTERAKAKKATSEELNGSTFTITSLGKLGGLLATPIINYPESAILSVHTIRTLPRYHGDSLVPRDMMNLSLSLDHRLIDGIIAAQFIQEIKELLERADFSELKTYAT